MADDGQHWPDVVDEEKHKDVDRGGPQRSERWDLELLDREGEGSPLGLTPDSSSDKNDDEAVMLSESDYTLDDDDDDDDDVMMIDSGDNTLDRLDSLPLLTRRAQAAFRPPTPDPRRGMSMSSRELVMTSTRKSR